MKSLGIFGGTFDPVHCGHLIIAEWVRDACHLDEVLFIPSAIPPHKQNISLTDQQHRLAMVELAIATTPCFSHSDIEMQSDRISYTAETLATLSDQYGDETELHLILGEDNLYDLPDWHDPERITALARILVARRADKPIRDIPAYLQEVVTVCKSPEIDISSTQIRSRIQAGKSIRFLVPETVELYIREHRLYTETDSDAQASSGTAPNTDCARVQSQ